MIYIYMYDIYIYTYTSDNKVPSSKASMFFLFPGTPKFLGFYEIPLHPSFFP